MKSAKEIISRVLDVSESELNGDSSPNSVHSWDSLATLRIITELESQFEVQFSMEEIEQMENLGSIQSLLNAKL